MATRKPAASTLLKQANARVEELEKKLTSSESSMKYHSNQASEAQAELNDMHAFFDALPNSIPRKDSESYQTRSAMTRLAAWLATRTA
jgi:uncharacterized coiled-coil protein SlyX